MENINFYTKISFINYFSNWSMLFLTSTVVFGCVGCSSPESHSTNTAPVISHTVAAATSIDHDSSSSSRLTQCNRDLESLHTVDIGQYKRYLSEYESLMKSSAGFMTVKDDVSPEVAELARPKFQFALVNLCYRIKGALAQTLINQANGQ